jgi:hypothetical protein
MTLLYPEQMTLFVGKALVAGGGLAAQPKIH